MFRSINTPACNSVVINGTLLSYTTRDGKSSIAKGQKPYRSATATIRVHQRVEDKEELSEIPVSFFAMRHKKNGDDNVLYDYLGDYANYKTADRDGIERASKVSINGRNGNGSLAENMFADSRNPETIVTNCSFNATFLNDQLTTVSDCATFNTEMFIFDMARELSSEGEETGRLKIRGGIVKYGGHIDCFDFLVENPSKIDFIERNYSVNDTAHFVGRIRYTTETVIHQSENTWGESLPDVTTRKKRELIITGPGYGHEDGPNDEENSYDPEEIRVAMADRNARKEAVRADAKNKSKKKAVAAAAPTTYEWEE